MPTQVQKVFLSLYSESDHKESLINIGESFVLEENKYLVTVFLSIPEITQNFVIDGLEIEVCEGEKRLGKIYKNLKKYEGIAGNIKKSIDAVGVIAGVTEDCQILKASLPISLNSNAQEIFFKIYPKEVHIQEAYATFEAKLFGIKYFLFNYFYTSLVLGVSWLFIAEVALGYHLNQVLKKLN